MIAPPLVASLAFNPDEKLQGISRRHALMASSCRYDRGKSRRALRRHARCPWRHSEGARHVDNTAIRRTRSPWRSCRSITTDGHGCSRGVAPLRPSRALRDIPDGTQGRSPPHRLTILTDAVLGRLSSFRLLALAFPHGCALEAMDRTVHERHHAGRQSVYTRQAPTLLVNSKTHGK